MQSNKYLVAAVLAVLICSFSHAYAASEKELIRNVQMEKDSKKAIQNFVENYKETPLQFIASGRLHHLPFEASFGIWVTSSSQQTIISARVLALSFTKAYLSELLSNKYTLAWYGQKQKRYPKYFPEKLSLKNVGIRIAFWDQNVERPKAPYLAEIDFYENTFRYYEADPQTQALKLVLEESYEKALSQVAESKSA
jgi:hypothetical protein